MILRSSEGVNSSIIKGLTSKRQLEFEFEKMLTNYNTAFIETDMRALYNPTRMGVIRLATQNLIKNIQSICPRCEAPGFLATKSIDGLPCEQCNTPTKSPLFYQFECAHCHCVTREKFPLKIQNEDPMNCDNCNP